jgi:hypothetical protein
VETASLILGVIGTVTGIGGLVWQLLTWRRNGPIVKVIGDSPIPYVGRTGVAGVTAWNEGRSPVTVTSCGLQELDGEVFYPGQPLPGSDQLPFRLEQGASGRWVVNVPQHRDTVPLRLRAYVRLANGKPIADMHRGLRYG